MSQNTPPTQEPQAGAEHPNTGPAPRSKRRKTMIAGAVAVVLILALATPFYLHAVSHESTDDAFIEAHVTTMSPRVAGHVSRVLVEENQMVKAGQVLVELDPRDFQAELDAAMAHTQSARAAVAEAQALASAAQNDLEQVQADLTSQHSGLAQVKAGVAEAKADYAQNEDDLGRIKRIVEAGAVSRQAYDHAKATEAISRAKLNSARRTVDTHSAKILQAQAAVRVAEDKLRQAFAQIDVRAADLRQAEAEEEQARLNLSYTRITAPRDGYVTKKALEPGSYVQVGQKIFSIVGSDVWVVANFKETQISGMRKGQPVDIEVDAYPGVTFAGHMDSIQRGTGSRFSLLPPENATGNYIKVVQRIPVKITLDADTRNGYLLAPGMSVTPSVDIAANRDAEPLQPEPAPVAHAEQ